jgi:hypothetical protein
MEKFIPTCKEDFRVGATVMLNTYTEVIICGETKTQWKVVQKINSTTDNPYITNFMKSDLYEVGGSRYSRNYLQVYDEEKVSTAKALRLRQYKIHKKE